MFWDRVSGLYDLFVNSYNGSAYQELGKKTAEFIDKDDLVLECACGTGAISCEVAPKCHKLVATDFSVSMMKQAKKKCRQFGNVIFRKADINCLKSRDQRFDKVIAGNVLHLLYDPAAAVWEMIRVCKTGGKVIIPTYIQTESKANNLIANAIDKAGANIRTVFTLDSYKEFFRSLGLDKTEFFVIDGRSQCAVAVIPVDHWHDMKNKELTENIPFTGEAWDKEHLSEYLVRVNYGNDNIAMRFLSQHLDSSELARILLEDFLLNDEYEGSEAQLGAAVVLRKMDRSALKANKELVLKAQKNEIYWKRPCNNADDLKWLLD